MQGADFPHALHDCRCREGDQSCAWFVAEKRKGQVAFDLGHFGTREASSHKHGRRRKWYVVGARVVVFSDMSSARVMGVRERNGSCRVLSDLKLSHFLRGGVQVALESRSIADSVQVRFVVSKTGQKRAGCTITRTRVASVGELREGSAESLRGVAGPTRSAPASAREITLDGQAYVAWLEKITWMEAAAALRLMIESSGTDPAQYALDSGRIGGAIQLATQGIPELQIQRAGRWKSRAFMMYVREAGRGSESVSAALAQSGQKGRTGSL